MSLIAWAAVVLVGYIYFSKEAPTNWAETSQRLQNGHAAMLSGYRQDRNAYAAGISRDKVTNKRPV